MDPSGPRRLVCGWVFVFNSVAKARNKLIFFSFFIIFYNFFGTVPVSVFVFFERFSNGGASDSAMEVRLFFERFSNGGASRLIGSKPTVFIF